jgi:hypothetical protein
MRYGFQSMRTGVLKNTDPFINIQVEEVGIPFIGFSVAIRKIKSANHRILYENPLIDEHYSISDEAKIKKLREDSFGKKVVKELFTKDY